MASNEGAPATKEGEQQQQQQQQQQHQKLFMAPAAEKKSELPERFSRPDLYEKAYEAKRPAVKNPLYMTTAHQLGARAPTKHELPKAYHPRPQAFSNSFTAPYRSHSLNTSLPKARPVSEYDLALF